MTPLEHYRQQIDHFFATSGDSPLEPTEQREFTGLNYFPESENFIFELEMETLPESEPYVAPTTTGDEVRFLRIGRFTLNIDDQSVPLTLLGSGAGDLFIPFRDATSGKTTYGAGRYLDDHRNGIAHLGGDRYRLDFNFAYNPTCAYSPYYSCPLPPRENWLAVAIEAGEKTFKN